MKGLEGVNILSSKVVKCYFVLEKSKVSNSQFWLVFKMWRILHILHELDLEKCLLCTHNNKLKLKLDTGE